MAARIAYTQFKRRNNPSMLALASNAGDIEKIYSEDEKNATHILAIEKSSSASSSDISLTSQLLNEENCSTNESKSQNHSHKTSMYGQVSDFQIGRSQTAIFPHYMARNPATITIREVDLPRLSDSFTVTLPNGHEIFQIERERPSWSHRQHIIDPVSNTTVLTVRRDIGKLPVSYGFDDDRETKVLDLHGNFSAPLQGARATAYFTNAIDQSQVQLSMQGSWHNRHGTVKNVVNGEIVATMRSGTFNTRNLIGPRRTYEVFISAGMDIAVITGMVIALDARSS